MPLCRRSLYPGRIFLHLFTSGRLVAVLHIHPSSAGCCALLRRDIRSRSPSSADPLNKGIPTSKHHSHRLPHIYRLLLPHILPPLWTVPTTSTRGIPKTTSTSTGKVKTITAKGSGSVVTKLRAQTASIKATIQTSQVTTNVSFPLLTKKSK